MNMKRAMLEFYQFLNEMPEAREVWEELLPNVDQTDPAIMRVAMACFLCGYSAGRFGHWPDGSPALQRQPPDA